MGCRKRVSSDRVGKGRTGKAMKKTIAAVAFSCISGSAMAQGYASHQHVQAFTNEPCSTVTSFFEMEGPEESGMEAQMMFQLMQGVYFGFILGYDTARGGLQEGDKSTLARLREECAVAPEKTAFEILESF